jgi:hypothetical protein
MDNLRFTTMKSYQSIYTEAAVYCALRLQLYAELAEIEVAHSQSLGPCLNAVEQKPLDLPVRI